MGEDDSSRREEISGLMKTNTEEMQSIERDILRLEELKRTLLRERTEYSQELRAMGTRVRKPAGVDISGKNRGVENDYEVEEFGWAGKMKRAMKDVWGIENYRLCQKGYVSEHCHRIPAHRDLTYIVSVTL